MDNINDFLPTKGRFIFMNEGNEGGPFHSRKFHVPGPTSGLTIGRGYDMKERSKAEIKTHLINAGISATDADVISNAATLKGADAKKFIVTNKLENFEVTMQQQLSLFNAIYPFYEKDTIRICTKPDVEEAYGKCNWAAIHPSIQELLVDLRYRGDYTGTLRKIIQKPAITNNFAELLVQLKNKNNFPGIDDSRFKARITLITEASKPNA